MISACCLVEHFKKSFNYSSVLQTEYNEKQNKNPRHPIIPAIKVMQIWDAQNDLYISSKIKTSGLTKLFMWKIADWCPNNFLNKSVSKPLTVKFRKKCGLKLENSHWKNLYF